MRKIPLSAFVVGTSAFAILLAVISPALSQKQRFSLEIRTLKNECCYVTGPLKVEVVLRNLSDKELFVDSFRTSFGRIDIELELYNEDGVKVSMTEIGNELYNPKEHPAFILGGASGTSLAPNEEDKTVIDLKLLYNISNKGNYSIKARKLFFSESSFHVDSSYYTIYIH